MFAGLYRFPDAQTLLDPLDAGVGQHRRVRFLVDVVVDVLAQAGNDRVHLLIQVRRFLRRAADDQRRARLVDQDRVHFVDDREVQIALNVSFDRILHVVAQVVEPEFRVRPVRHVAPIVRLALPVGKSVDDDAHRQAEELVDAPHPLGIAAGQVVVDRDHVDALAAERVQIHGQGRDQRLAFAGLHLGDAPAVQDHPAHQLHVEVPHPQHPATGLAADRKRLRQDVVQGGALDQLAPQCGRHGLELVVGLGCQAGFEVGDARDVRTHRAQNTSVLGSENLLCDEAEHRTEIRRRGGSAATKTAHHIARNTNAQGPSPGQDQPVGRAQ